MSDKKKEYEYDEEEQRLCMLAFMKTPTRDWEGESAWIEKRKAEFRRKNQVKSYLEEGGMWF